ncbi:MAG: FGGY family carbohydrate kinase [Candidatus Saccharibacteria bacterium]|nr:FGGY family carbohydrate kinase [Candidatus Saccharibacteria bacterium]
MTFTTQGETLIPVDKNGNALANAIVWLDTRAGEEAEFIKNNISIEEFYSVMGRYMPK